MPALHVVNRTGQAKQTPIACCMQLTASGFTPLLLQRLFLWLQMEGAAKERKRGIHHQKNVDEKTIYRTYSFQLFR
jgi:hypothetical protein